MKHRMCKLFVFSLPRQRSLGTDVYAKRSRSGLSQERMAECLQISLGEYKRIESNGHIPKTAYFLLICWQLHLDPLCYLKQALEREDRDVLILDKEGEAVSS